MDICNYQFSLHSPHPLFQFSSVAQSCLTLCNPMGCSMLGLPVLMDRSMANSRSLPKLMSIASVMPSNHLILCRPLLLLPSIFLSTRVFSNELVLHISWPGYWSFSFSISPFYNSFSYFLHCYHIFVLKKMEKETYQNFNNVYFWLPRFWT